MRQHSLFEPSMSDASGLVPARSRHYDPESSRAAAKEIEASGQLTGDRGAVYDAIKSHPGSTAGEIAELLGPGWDNVRVSRRTADLESMGVARKGEQRECAIKGRRMVTWFAL